MNNIYPGFVASAILLTDEGHSWRIWLWKSQEDLKRWADRYSAGRTGEPGEYDGCMGLHSPCEVMLDGEFQHIGEIHFVLDHWDLETVVHECTHGLFHYIRCLIIDFPRMLYMGYIENEEEICYPFGKFVELAYKWLWKKNPNPSWQKEWLPGEHGIIEESAPVMKQNRVD
jgi:hypothetical protein